MAINASFDGEQSILGEFLGKKSTDTHIIAYKLEKIRKNKKVSGLNYWMSLKNSAGVVPKPEITVNNKATVKLSPDSADFSKR